MSGSLPGTSGHPHLVRACIVIILLLGTVCTINALSILDEAAADREWLPPWQPFGLEYSSLAGSVLGLPIPLLIERYALGRPFLRAVALAVPASLLFSGIHVAAMVGLRHLLWWSHGLSYSFESPSLFYEYRKDAISFAVILAIFFIARRWPARPEMTAPEPATIARAFLANGRRQVEIDVTDLLAVGGGGNYTELMFAGGRTSLVRTTLGAAEEALAPHGFRRTHKSWLVNLDRVRSVARTASGDYCLTLGESLEVPLSRRNGAVLDEIRASATGRQGPLPID
jgi:hypothetical protein